MLLNMNFVNDNTKSIADAAVGFTYAVQSICSHVIYEWNNDSILLW